AATANAAAKATPVSDVLLKREPRHRTLEPLVATARTDLLVVGAATVHDLEGRVREIKDQLAAGTVTQETFSSYAAQVSRQGVGKPVRLALVVENLNELPPRLDLGLEAVKEPKKRIMVAPKGIYVGEGAHRGKMAMLFPGQGSQYADMLRDLSTRFETVKRTLEQIDAVMTPFLGKPITEFIFLDPAKGVTREAAEEALKQTAVTQPAMLTADLALYRLLGDYGVKPDMVAGHSLGEYGALVASGVMTLEDACIAVSARGREMANVHVPDLGKMASVTADPATVEKLLKNVEGYVIPANKNCKVQTVIAGSSKSVEAAVAMFNQAGIQAQHIAVSAAFHSQIVAPAIVPLQRVFERLDIREPKIALLSNVTADYYPTGPGAREKIIDLLSRQVAAAVEWQKQTERMYHDGARLFVEVGPKTVLTTFTKNTLEGKEFVAVGTNHPKRGGFYHFFDALAILAAWGYQLKIPDPTTADVSLPAFREATQAFQPAAPPGAAVVPAMSDARAKLIQQLTTQMRQLQAQVEALASGEGAGDGALQRRIEQLGLNLDKIVVSGVSVGLPGMHKRLFDDDNFDRILRGENLIDKIDEAHQRRMLDKNIVRLVKSEKGDHRFEAIKDVADVVRLAGRMGGFDFVQDYGIGADFADALDVTSELAIAAGIEALRDAGIPLVRSLVKTSTGKFLPGDWVLPEPLQQETGIIFASAFPGYNRLIEAVSNYFAAKHGGKGLDELADIYAELIQTVRDPEVRRRVTDWYTRNFQAEHRAGGKKGAYEFNRKFLFHVLSLGHAQLAQLIKAKGPNTQLNAACSSTTQAVGVAEDWIRTGRCKRVLVVGADDITSDTSLEWFSSGFLAAGAASTKDRVEDAALPFDRRRHGMIIGMGAVGLVVEGDKEVRSRGMEPIVEIVASHIANSAYHGSRLDTEHVATEMDRLLAIAEKRLGVPRSQLAPQMLFMSHETYTPARGGSAAAEIEALRKTFGPDANKVVVSNTKGFTGHSMGASIEDAIAVKSLQRGRVPPIANLKEPDPALGDLNLSHGGEYNLQYALRLAAGFGSQIAFLLFKLRSKDDRRIVDPATYQAWLTRMSGNPRPELEVASRALRIKSTITQALAVAKPDAPPAPTPRPASKPPTPKPAPVPVPAAPRPQPVGPVPAMAEIQGRIVDLIAEKTGYPKEMLDPNLDLEADLGIDTVKQAELFGFVRDTYSLAREDNLQLKDYPTIAKIAHYIQSRVGRATTIAAVTSAAVVHAPAAVTAVPAVVIATPVAAITPEAVFARLIDLVAEKTGYPKEMLDPNLDLEADLGIDTVKQAEVFGLLREHYQLPRDDSLQLKDYPTLTKIADYIASRASGTLPQRATPTPPSVPSTPSTTTTTTAAAPSRPSPASVSLDSLQRRVVDVIAEKTGYPKEMLDPNLDLEADLGIDTVKQAELFGLIRETYQLARDDSLQLKDYPTIAKIAGYIHSRLNGAAATAAPSTVPLPAPASPLPVSSPARPSPASAPAIGASTKDRAAVVARIRALIAEKTGYPMDLLDENLDLEADLGIDTVKQAELFGFVREAYGIARVENLQLSNYSTIAKVADFAIENAGKPGTP
ncbi:MAG TPA: acyltransferase domain-containing protein, partial [Candidatus Thermoplasmatota archaeon]|nr:acyltransferase domain-containing protein [Candidatus Thermoplasmatota archaeon]